jgi:hypothetical protein
VAISTCEAKHYSAANATKERIHLGQLMGEIFNSSVRGTTTIWEDNQCAIAYSSQNALVNEKTKHIDLKWHFLKDHIEMGIAKLLYLPTDRMVVEMLTKASAKTCTIKTPWLYVWLSSV